MGVGALKPLWEKQQTFQSLGPKQSPCLLREEGRKQNQSACGGEETSSPGLGQKYTASRKRAGNPQQTQDRDWPQKRNAEKTISPWPRHTNLPVTRPEKLRTTPPSSTMSPAMRNNQQQRSNAEEGQGCEDQTIAQTLRHC